MSVAWDEIHETTDSAPIHHLHVVLGGTLLVLGVALLMLPAAGFARLSGSGERGTASVAVTFATVGTFFAALPVLAGAVASAVGMDPVTDFVTIAAFEVPALGFAAWLTTRLLAAGIWALETGAWWGALIVVADVLWVVRSIVTTVPMAGLRPAPATDSGWAPGTASKVRRGGKGTA